VGHGAKTQPPTILEDIETLLMTSKMWIFLYTRFILSYPSLPQQSSQNFCIFRVAKNTSPRFGAPSAGVGGHMPPSAPYPLPLNVFSVRFFPFAYYTYDFTVRNKINMYHTCGRTVTSQRVKTNLLNLLGVVGRVGKFFIHCNLGLLRLGLLLLKSFQLVSDLIHVHWFTCLLVCSVMMLVIFIYYDN